MKNKDLQESYALLSEYESGLTIDKESLDEEIVTHPATLYTVSIQAIKTANKRDSKKAELKRLQAELAEGYRSEGKIAIAAAADKAIADPRYKNKERAHLRLVELAASWDALRNAFHSRGYALRDLASLYVTQHYQPESVREPRPRPKRKRSRV